LPDVFRTSALSSLKSYAAAVANWLEKSASSPLSISVYDSRDSFIPKEHYEIIIDSFLPFAHRWKDLVLDTYSPSLNRIAALTEDDVPLLESLSLRDLTLNNVNDPSNPPLVWKTSGIVRSHRLQKIDYTQVQDNITLFSFKWGQLTDIKLGQTSYDWGAPANATLSDLILVLSLSPRLINFHSEIGLLLTTGLVPPSSISSLPLLNLQKFVFHDGGTPCKALFELLDVPSLLHLEFFPTDNSNFTILPTFLPQAADKILSLTTSYSFFANYRYVLSECQKLISITIKSPPSLGTASNWSPAPVDFIEDIFLEGLTLPIDHPDRLAPALEVFDCYTGVSFSDAAVLNFIKAKQSRTDIANLKRLTITFTRPSDLDILSDEKVAQCRENGLVVEFSYPLGLNPKMPFAFTPDAGIRRADSRFGWSSSSEWRTWQ
jgi:hypothetical protein